MGSVSPQAGVASFAALPLRGRWGPEVALRGTIDYVVSQKLPGIYTDISPPARAASFPHGPPVGRGLVGGEAGEGSGR